MDQASLLGGMRVGFGFCVRRFTQGAPLWLGGAAIAHSHGLGAGIDGDIVCHAVLEALLSAAGLPGAAVLFEDDPTELNSGEPLVMLSQVALALRRQHLSALLNVSVQVAAAQPDLSSYRKPIVLQLASALEVEPGQVALTITSRGGLEEVDAGRSAVAFANVLCVARTGGAPSATRGRSAAATAPLAVADGGGGESESMPERVVQFERAVSSKLPPLPPAPKPGPGDELIVYTDGASRGNPGPSAVGWVVFDALGRLVHEHGSVIGERTNNQAEYLAVSAAAEWIEHNLGREHTLHFRLDSELVAKQLRGEYKIKEPGLKQLAMEAMNALMYFDGFDLTYVPRSENSRADALANKALDEQKK